MDTYLCKQGTYFLEEGGEENGDPKRISKLSIGSVDPRKQRKPLSPGFRAGEINYYPGKISHLLLHAKEEGNVTRAKRFRLIEDTTIKGSTKISPVPPSPFSSLPHYTVV